MGLIVKKWIGDDRLNGSDDSVWKIEGVGRERLREWGFV